MATAVVQGATGDAYIDGLLIGTSWDGSFAFGFPQNVSDSTTAPVSFGQREAARGIMNGTAFNSSTYLTSINSLVALSGIEVGGLGSGLAGASSIGLGTFLSASSTAYAYDQGYDAFTAEPSPADGNDGRAENGSGATTFAVSATGNQGIDGLLRGNGWAGGSITYSDPTAANQYQAGHDELFTNFQHIDAQQIVAMHFALNAAQYTQPAGAAGFSVEGFTNLSVTYAGANGTGTIRLANTSNPGTAYAYYPSSAVEGGDAFFGGSGRTPVMGDYDWHTVLHELGHSLGLKHGQETDIFGAMPSNVDSMEFSVMTYRSYIGAPLSGYTNEQYGYAQTYMMYDIAALQHMYGADYSTNSGNTTYTWNPLNGNTVVNGLATITPGGNRIFLTIWDGGGTDTYDMSAYSSDLDIDLAAGGYSDFNSGQSAYLGGGPNGGYARGNVFNAFMYLGNTASLIENATGGSGSDSITGNEVNNLLTGNAGDDTLQGLDGNDTLNGGIGVDLMKGGGGDDTLNGGDDNDTLKGGGGADALNGGLGIDVVDYSLSTAVWVDLEANTGSGGEAFGDTFSSIENVNGSAESDIITGNGSNNEIAGGDGIDIIKGGGGSDTLYGGDGDDSLQGGFSTDTINGGNGNDTITVLEGEYIDNVDGGADIDTLSLSDIDGTGGIPPFEVTGPVVIDTAAGTWTMNGTPPGFGGPATLVNVERIIGTQFGDNITGSNSAGANAITYIDGQGGDDAITGDGGNNEIHGGTGNDVLYGNNGTDTLFGEDGDDLITSDGDNGTYDGGAGNDVMFSGFGGETMDGGADVDTIDHTIYNADYTFDMVTGLTQFFGELYINFENVNMGDGNDTVTGTSGANIISAAGGNDTVNDGAGSDTISGGDGDDTFIAGDSSFLGDSWDGGTGTDRLSYQSFNWGAPFPTVNFDLDADTAEYSGFIESIVSIENFTGSNGNEFIYGASGENNDLDGLGGDDYIDGRSGDDNIDGGAGTDTLKGGDGADTLVGGDGNDNLSGGAGIDSLTGGLGDDTLVVESAADAVFEAIGGGTDTVITSQTYALAAGQEIERLQTNNQAAVLGLGLIGNEFANRLTANAGNNTLNGGAGIDLMFGLGGNDTYYVDNAADVVGELVGGGTDQVLASVTYTLAGGQEIETLKTTNDAGLGNINLTGNEFNNSMTGNAGNNVLTGGLGSDTMRGLGGNDSFVVDNAGDVVIELVGNGTDTVFASVSFALQSGQEIENLQTNNAAAVTAINLTGNNLNNIITGNAGNNTLNGGLGVDTLTGLGGNDLYIVDNAGDVVVELVGGGTDTVSTIVSYTLGSGREIEVLQTGNAGGTDALVLTGNQLAQTIIGNAGNNTLYGKLGLDTLTGGNGQDSFVFDTTLGAANIDTITSFIVADDTILLASSIFTALGVGPLLGGAFNTGAAATQADDHIIYNSVTKALLYDVDGAGGAAAVQFATLTNIGGALSAADFLII